MSYYIAYGSNLNREQMKYRCPTAKVIGNGFVNDYRLLFRIYATIERQIGKKVPVSLWEIDDECEVSLDRYEGYPRLYRKEIIPVCVNDKTYDAMVYIMNENVRPYQLPTESYYSVVVQGYEDMGLETKYIDMGIQDTRLLLKETS